MEEIMNYQTYINITDDFVNGIKDYLNKKGIPLDTVVEVFAGDGTLGIEIGLKEDLNISDLLTFTYEEHKDDVNKDWPSKPHGVVEESAYETVIRFSAESDCNIRLLIMAAPPEGDDAYEAAKALHHRFDAKILFIGDWDSIRFASSKFFVHMEDVVDDEERSFETLVENKYDSENGYFTSDYFEEPIAVQPYFKRFKPCNVPDCDCRNDAKIRSDVQKYINE
jgi:hypothetical protein